MLYFLSLVHAFLLSVISVFAFLLASALRTRKVQVPFSCTRFSTFRNPCICFPSRKRFKDEEGSNSFLLYTLFYLP